MGSIPALYISANGLVWAQNWPQTMLSMSLHGPNTSLKALSRWPCMGPAHTPKIAISDLAWAQTAIKYNPPAFMDDYLNKYFQNTLEFIQFVITVFLLKPRKFY